MRSMISGAKPGPSSLMITATFVVGPVGGDLDPLVREIDRVLQQVAEPVEDRRIARADRRRHRLVRQRNVDRDAEIAVRRDHLLDQRGQRQRSNGSPLRQLRRAWPGCRGSAAPARAAACTSSACGEFGSIARSSSFAITEMVESGVPSSCAAAAASPSSCDRCCSRASTSSVAASASASWRPSSVSLPRVDADEADGEQDREPDAEQIDRRQLQRIVADPTAADSARTPGWWRTAPRTRRASA